MTSPLGPTDYATFQADLLIVRLQLEASRTALRQALEEKRNIECNLADAQKRYDDLVASATQHSDDSMLYYPELLEEVRRLRQQLSASRALAAGLRQSLESARAEYDLKLAQAQKRAQALERENRRLKIGLGVAGAAALGLGIWAAVK